MDVTILVERAGQFKTVVGQPTIVINEVAYTVEVVNLAPADVTADVGMGVLVALPETGQ